MKTVVFFISSYNDLNTGVGGHYRSIKEIATLLKPHARVHVFTFGNVPSPVLRGLDRYEHLECGSIFSPATWSRLRSVKTRITQEADGEIIYISVGDLSCYIPVLLTLGLGSGAAVAHLKPGGPVFPRSQLYNGIPMMLFHGEDFELFKKLDPNRPLSMAAGRVMPPPLEPDYLSMAVPKLQAAEGVKPRLLCVCRIANEKLGSLRKIYGALSHIESDIQFAHIGVVQDTSVKEELSKQPLSFDYEILSAPEVCDTAARALHACDYFTGIGRSLVEAHALGKVAFVPVNDTDGSPRLVALTHQNWRVMNHHNFTDRVTMEELKAAGEVIYLEQVAADPEKYAYLGVDSQAIYDENLSAKSAEATWLNFLDEAVKYRQGRQGEAMRFAFFIAQNLKRSLQPKRL